MSPAPATGRQTVPAGCSTLGGQFTLSPEHVSGMSHGPAEGRQDVPAGWTRSVGHCVLDPVHSSGLSQTSTAARQTVPAGRSVSTGAGVARAVADLAGVADARRRAAHASSRLEGLPRTHRPPPAPFLPLPPARPP